MSEKRFALIGANVSGSYSAELHRIISERGKHKYEYELLSVAEDELGRILRDERYSGFNVTMPYKSAVISYLDELSDEAASIGAVNTVVKKDGKLIGYNTDIYGFEEMAGVDRVKGRKCLVFGTGGASKAIAEALRRMEAREIISVSRDPSRGVTYSELDSHLDAEVIVNTTPVGMSPDIMGSPLQEAIGDPEKSLKLRDFAKLETLLDIIYTPSRTRLMREAQDAGVVARSGLKMLVYQGIASSALWHGENLGTDEIHELAQDTMKEILEDRLNLVVIGMPGSGKSSISRRIAKLWGRPFIDIDSLTAEKLGMPIPEAIKSRGAEYFRGYERLAVEEASLKNGTVIATGGGSVLSETNRAFLSANSIIVYLKRPTGLLAKKDRPISDAKGVEKIYDERASIYENLADITVNNVRKFGSSRDKRGRQRSYNEDLNAFAKRIIGLYYDSIQSMD